MGSTRLGAVTVLALLFAACGSVSGDQTAAPAATTLAQSIAGTTPIRDTTTSKPITTVTTQSSTTTSPSEVQPSRGEYTASGKPFNIYEPSEPTHIVVLLHGLNTPLGAMERLASQFHDDGGLVFVPAFDLAIAPENRAEEATQVACAVAFASSLNDELPLVLVGFSGGGLHAGLYVATNGSFWDPTACAVDAPGRPLDGFVLLDGPVDVPGWREAVGLPPNDWPDAALFDPVSVAIPNADISGAYFISVELPDYARSAMEKFNQALGIDGPITQLDTSHGGLISATFPEIPAAVLDVAGLG